MLHDETIGRVVGIECGRSEWLPALWASLTTRIEIWHLLAVCQWTLGGDIVWFELNRTDRGATMSFIPSWPESPGLDGAAGRYNVCLGGLRVLFDTGSAPPTRRERGRMPDASERNKRSDSCRLRVVIRNAVQLVTSR